jgi:hypothetical protein
MAPPPPPLLGIPRICTSPAGCRTAGLPVGSVYATANTRTPRTPTAIRQKCDSAPCSACYPEISTGFKRMSAKGILLQAHNRTYLEYCRMRQLQLNSQQRHEPRNQTNLHGCTCAVCPTNQTVAWSLHGCRPHPEWPTIDDSAYTFRWANLTVPCR